MSIKCLIFLLVVGVYCVQAWNPNLKYFGFYTYNHSDYERMPYANLYESADLNELVLAHTRGMQGMWYLQYIFFTPSMALRTDYLDSWGNASQQVAPLLKNGTVLGFFMGDELINNGVTWANLDLTVSLVRKTFPDSIIYTNEAFVTFQDSYEFYPHVPVDLDWVSIDYYPVWGTFNTLRSIYYNNIYPKMSGNQKVMFVSGVFSTVVNPSYYCGNPHCEQVMIAWNLQALQWAQWDDRFVGIFPWHFDTFNTTFLPGFEIGLDTLPYLTQAITNIATQITTGKPLPPQPLPSGTMCGFSAGTPSAVTLCNGVDPTGSCPDGYTLQRWEDVHTGGGVLSFCSVNDAIADGYTPEGGICGFNNGGGDLVPCGGLDPIEACPEGYLQTVWHVSWGDSYLFFCEKQNATVPDPTGSICGMVTNNGATGVFCNGQNPYQSCPTGYAQASWTNVDFGQHDWGVCFKI